MKNAVCRDLNRVAANIGVSGASTRTESGLTDTKDMYVCRRSIGSKALRGVAC
jgi:hypothetical protein